MRLRQDLGCFAKLPVALGLALLAACSSPMSPAPIVDRSKPVAPVVIYPPGGDRAAAGKQGAANPVAGGPSRGEVALGGTLKSGPSAAAGSARPPAAAKPAELAKAVPSAGDPIAQSGAPRQVQRVQPREQSRDATADTGTESRRDPVKDSAAEATTVRPIRNPEVVSVNREVSPASGVTIPAGPPAGTAAGTPAGPPAGTAAGTPAGPPAGTSAGTPAGPPAGTSTGTSAGPPAGTAAGTPGGPLAGQETRTEPRSDSRPDPTPSTRPEQAPELEWIWPAEGKTTHTFSAGKGGVRIEGNSGDPILAIGDGKVIFAGQGPKGYGNLLIVRHEGELLSVYAHNRALLVQEGSQVRKGQKIAEMGDSGADRAQLGFELRRNGRPIDPRATLPPR